MDLKREICIFTGSRAEYSALYHLIRAVDESSEVKLHLLVAASHLSPEFGFTFRDIVRDGFSIDSRVEMLLSSDTDSGVVKSMGLGIISFADVFSRIRPHILVVAGDRYEALAVAQAAYVMDIPVAHIGGGEVTGGSLDEGFRHAITKLSKLHFVANAEYARRVRQLGEAPESIFQVGPPALESLLTPEIKELEVVSREIGFDLSADRFALCTYHSDGVSTEAAEGVLAVLGALDLNPALSVVFTSSNSDASGREVNRRINDWCTVNSDRSVFVSNLGRENYFCLLRSASFVLGNSSSGIIEAPAAGVPTVNVGERQVGRIQQPSVIQCDETISSIQSAITEARTSHRRLAAKRYRSEIVNDRSSTLMLQKLLETDLSFLGMKKFVDVTFRE